MDYVFFFFSTPSYRCSLSINPNISGSFPKLLFFSRGAFFFSLPDHKVIWKEMMDRFVDQRKERKWEDDLLVLTLAKENAAWSHSCRDCSLRNSLYSPQTASLGGEGGAPHYNVTSGLLRTWIPSFSRVGLRSMIINFSDHHLVSFEGGWTVFFSS